MKKIPYSTQCIDNKDILAVREVLESDYLTQGPKVCEFENRIAKYCGAKYAVAVNSGTSALHAACFAAGIVRENEVITSPITFAATANCVLYCGGRPVFADIQNDTVNIDPQEIKNKISKKTKAIIPVHFAGHPCDLKEIHEIAKKNNLIVIEDAAHALGALYKGSKIGSCKYSNMAILSFHAVKHITTGEGGMILTNDKNFYNKLKIFRTHGITKENRFLKNTEPWYYEMQELGFNYRLTDIQCALGISQFNKLPDFLRRRANIVSVYDKVFSKYKDLKILKRKPYVNSAHHLYILRFNLEMLSASKLQIFNEFIRQGIGINVHFIPVYFHPYYRKLGYKRGLCPLAEKYYQQAITLPLYPKLTDSQVKKVIRVTKKIIDKFKIKTKD